jgi:Rap1a immunity proteins
MNRAVLGALLLSNLCQGAIAIAAPTGIAVPYYGPILPGKTPYPPDSLGQYIVICDPARDPDNARRRNNDPYCEGYARALLDATVHYGSACFPPEGVETSIVLSIGHLRANKDRKSLQQQAFGQLLQALSEQFPCKR